MSTGVAAHGPALYNFKICPISIDLKNDQRSPFG
jgi:hypothetical protein